MKQTTYKNSSNDNEIADDNKMLQSLKAARKLIISVAPTVFSSD